LPLSNEKPAS